MTPHERLVAFIYLLMRDEVPVGTVRRMVRIVEEADRTARPMTFLIPELKDLAERTAEELTE